MKKFFIYTSLVIFAIAVGRYYIPQSIKEKAMAFIGAAASRDTEEIKTFLGDTLLPQNPKDRREVLIKELKKDLYEIKRRTKKTVKDGKTITPAEKFDNKTTEEIISSSEDIIKELEVSNNDRPLGQEVGERILDIIFPGRPTPEQCSK